MLVVCSEVLRGDDLVWGGVGAALIAGHGVLEQASVVVVDGEHTLALKFL